MEEVIKAFIGLLYILTGLCVVFIPLGIWKLIEIIAALAN